ncbi:MAG: hypothetical protein ABFD20_12195, partial [Anaerolineales bacterium]
MSSPGATQHAGRGLALCLGVALALALINLPVGLSGDLDGYFVAEKAAAWGAQGWAPSRGWGFPAYEAAIYPLVYWFGPWAGKLYALAHYLGAVALFYGLALRVQRERPPSVPRAVAATLALVAVPIVIISGNTLLETSQGLFWGLAALSVASRYLERPSVGHLVALALALGVATATRLDAVLLAAAIALTLWRYARPTLGQAAVAVALFALSGLAPYALYREAWRTATVVLPDPLGQRALRAGVGVVQVLGPLGWAALVGVGWWRWRHGLRPPPGAWEWLFGVAVALYGLRFVLLPDELEYLILLVPLLLLVCTQRGWTTRQLATLAVALCCANLFQVYVLAADVDGARHLALGISPGAIWQDRTARLRLDYVYSTLPTQFDELAAQYGASEYSTLPSEQEGALVIIPRDQT